MNRPVRFKIGLVFDDSLDRPDGVTQYVLTIGRWLSGQGHEVHYLVGETTRQDILNVHSLSRNLVVKFNKNRVGVPLPARLKSIRELLQREQFDVLHVQVPYSPTLAGRIIAAAGPRTAVTGMFHVAPYSRLVVGANHVLGAAVQRTVRRFDLMLANTKATAAFAKRTFRVNCRVLPLPLDLSAFMGAKPLDKLAATKNVVFLGRLVERKGCAYLLQAVAYAVAAGVWPKGVKVTICGGGPLASKLHQFVADNHLQTMVTFAGHLTEAEKPRYLAAADIAIYPSVSGESFGIVLLEAMAACRGAVLAGNNPGYASILEPRPEALFDPLDTPALAAQLVALLNDDKARAAANHWQQRHVKSFDVSRVGVQTVKLFEQALQSRRG